MKAKQFYTLNVGQTIYHNGKKEKIEQLSYQGDNWLSIVLRRQECVEVGYNWRDIHKDCSLELPERYKRYEDAKIIKNGKLMKGNFLEVVNYLGANKSLDCYSDIFRLNSFLDLITDIVDGKVEL